VIENQNKTQASEIDWGGGRRRNKGGGGLSPTIREVGVHEKRKRVVTYLSFGVDIIRGCESSPTC
jgi:hypothetical protein